MSKNEFHKLYELGKILGRGNYSVVKEAVERNNPDKKVAVKCVTKAKLTKEDEEALTIETQILREMDHPNIIKMFNCYEDEEKYYLVTEMMTGGELFDRIVEKEFYSEADAQKVLSTLGAALLYCHVRGVVHRDLKPENILLTNQNDDASIKIADFGFAKKVTGAGPGDGASLTTACGTPGYVAPEIINGKQYGKEVDMWSLGVILYILLCGYPPFHDDNQVQLFKMIRKGQYEFDKPYWDNVSAEAKDLITHLLCVDASKRYTVEQMLDHKWLKTEASTADISLALKELRKFQARKRWKTAITTVKVTNKMGNLIKTTKSVDQQEAAK